jgi:PKD domain
MLAGGNVSFTGSASGGIPPYKFNWTFGDGSPIGNGSFVTHIYALAGNYTVTLSITDFTTLTIQVSQTVQVKGSPLVIDGWLVNWNITAEHGIEIFNVTYNGVLTIRDALITGVLVRYFQQPPGFSCLFFDDLGDADITSSIAGLSLQFSPGPNPWFQIRAQYNPSGIGYNYTQFWRFYQDGRWDATLDIGHIGCGWNHTYQPHWRIDLAVGNKNADLMSQYSPDGWQNLIWEGNYTDNGLKDPAHNSTQWRFGDGRGYFYMTPKVVPWATDMPLIAPKIYLVKDRAGELEPNPGNPADPRIDPIMFAHGELAYRQSIAFWYLPTLWDHWLYSVGSPPIGQPSVVSLSFYPSGI